MPGKRAWTFMLWCAALAWVGGCQRSGVAPTAPKVDLIAPPGVAGTVGEYATLAGGQPLAVRGWGVVVGLGQNGSPEMPEALRRYILDEMKKYKLGSPSAGTDMLTPARLLNDKDTTVVTVTALIPPAAPEGTRFDVHVEALPQSQTVSLDGGYLMSTELRLAAGGGMVQFQQAQVSALAKGAIFVNPFADRASQTDQSRLRSGLIPGGGTVTVPRQVRLELRQPDYRVVGLIKGVLNQRFGPDVANTAHPALVDIRIPPAYRSDYIHFLQLVTHLYLASGPSAQEAHARQLGRAILLPTALHDDIALVWEAMGRQVLPVVRELYASDNASAVYHALRTGLRLQDSQAVEGMMKLAALNGSPYQIPAVDELGRARQFIQCVPALTALLSSSNDLLRVAAYEALLSHGAPGAVRHSTVGGAFALDIVDSDRDYAVYATRSGQPKIVLFGKNIAVNRPVFYCPSDELVTIHALSDDAKIKVDRRLPRGIRRSDTFEVSAQLPDLIRTLGSMPEEGADGKIEGLGLTYSQVVSVLYGLNKEGHVPAKFVLQRSPQVQRIYPGSSAAGRSDSPEETP